MPAPEPYQVLKSPWTVIQEKTQSGAPMKRVIIESPFSATSGLGSVAANVEYARKCCLDAVMRQENPFASHVFYTQFLDDENPQHRTIGIGLGFDWWAQADLVVFYVDNGMSNGMKDALAKCVMEDIPFEKRSLKSVELIESQMERLKTSQAAVGDAEKPHPAMRESERKATSAEEAIDRFAKNLTKVD
jgi:hypothetical protein